MRREGEQPSAGKQKWQVFTSNEPKVTCPAFLLRLGDTAVDCLAAPALITAEDQWPTLAHRKRQSAVGIEQVLDILARFDGTDEQAIAAWLQAMASKGFA
ncbi:hypothetical protein D3C81_1201450 [compost metagenome]